MRKNLNNKKRKEDILRLRSEGKSFNQISKELSCSKSLISYHCGDGSEKKRSSENNKKRPILHRKISSFKCKPPRKVLSTKLKGFKRHSKGARYRNKSSVNSISENYSIKDVEKKISDNPICYLTGKKINLEEGSSYHLDHIIPTYKGGTNDLDNLGICIAEANQAKGTLFLEELYELCESILEWRDIKNQ